jgi:hypothetical protein
MKRKCLFLIVSIAVGLLFLSTVAMATPLEGTYFSETTPFVPNNIIDVGKWKEVFGPLGQGMGDSELTANAMDRSVLPAVLSNQWYVDMW